jgi:vancomycin resistance protein VanW
MCQLTNLIHWLVLHSSLDITEHHHHNNIDLFPDFGRSVPFGTGTSISYNRLNYEFKNNTESLYQLIIYTTDTYLCGELRCDQAQKFRYHIVEKNVYFEKIQGQWYRNNKIYRTVIDKATGKELSNILLRQNHARVLYDPQFINKDMIRNMPVKNERAFMSASGE